MKALLYIFVAELAPAQCKQDPAPATPTSNEAFTIFFYFFIHTSFIFKKHQKIDDSFLFLHFTVLHLKKCIICIGLLSSFEKGSTKRAHRSLTHLGKTPQ